MRNFFLLIIIACGYSFFYLIPNTHIKGVFRVSDVGLLIVFVSLFVLFFNKKNAKIAFNAIGFLILMYLAMVLMHVSLASANYNQSVFSGLISSRHQFYYLSYFVFLLALDSDEKVESFLKVITITAVVILIASIINYAGLTLFHHEQWAEGHGERLGIKRAYMPAMNIIGLVFIWQFTRYINNSKRKKNAWGALAMMGGLLFRQTRGRIIAAVLVAGWMLVVRKKIKLLAISVGGLMLLSVVFMMMGSETNILTATFESAATDVTEQEGTWRGRAVTLEIAINEFMKNPILGSGSNLIRNINPSEIELLMIAYQGDLGYAHWLKNYGLLGVAWMVAIIWFFFKNKRKREKIEGQTDLTDFSKYQFLHILVSGITLDYWARVDGILVTSLVLAIITREIDKSGSSANVSIKEPSKIKTRQNAIGKYPS